MRTPGVARVDTAPGVARVDTAPGAAEFVRAIRTAAGLSIRALARCSGVAPSTISRIEAGAVDPGIGTLRQLAAASGSTLHLSFTHPYPTTAGTRPGSPGARAARRPELAALSNALRTTPAGTGPDWTRLRAFVDWAQRHPSELLDSLAAAPASCGDRLLDNLLAGIAEKLSDDAGVRRPAWARQVAPMERTWRAALRGAAVHRERSRTPTQLLLRQIELGEANLWRDREDRAEALPNGASERPVPRSGEAR